MRICDFNYSHDCIGTELWRGMGELGVHGMADLQESEEHTIGEHEFAVMGIEGLQSFVRE